MMTKIPPFRFSHQVVPRHKLGKLRRKCHVPEDANFFSSLICEKIERKRLNVPVLELLVLVALTVDDLPGWHCWVWKALKHFPAILHGIKTKGYTTGQSPLTKYI